MTADREETTIWRNARLATFAAGAPGLGVVEPGALVARGGTIVFAGPERDAPSPRRRAERRLRGPLDHARPDRLPHPSRLRRQPRGGIRGAARRRKLRGDRARRRRHRLDRPRDARGERGRARPPVPAAPRRADRRRRHDGRDQVRLRPRPRDRAQDAARRPPPREPSARSTVRTTFLGAHALPPEYRGRPRRLCRRGRRRDAAGARGGRARRRGRRVLRDDRLLARRDARAFSRARDASDCPSNCTRSSCRTAAARELAAEFRRAVGRPSRICRRGRRRGNGARGRRSRRCCPAPSTCCARRRRRRSSSSAGTASPMAVATDCNPGTSPMTSLLLAMNMAATLFRLTVEECLAGVTRNAARALGLAAEIGTLEPGKSRGPRDLGHRAPGRAGLPHRLQSAARARLEGTMTLRLAGGAASLADWRAIYRGRERRARSRLRTRASRLRRGGRAHRRAGEPVYGINTGFGKLASVRIADEDLATLQRNIVLSHAAGVGEPASVAATRLMMALKLDSLAQGASGVRVETLALLEAMLARGVMPVVPAQGSVGASGDLAPLAHMTAAMIGVGEARFGGERPAGRGRAGERRARARGARRRRKVWRCSTARSFRPRMRWPACSRPSACSARRWSPARSRPMRRAAPTRRSIRASTRCAAIAARSRWPRRLARPDGRQRDPRLHPAAIRACRTPIACAASHR